MLTTSMISNTNKCYDQRISGSFWRHGFLYYPQGRVSQGNYSEFNINEYCGDFAEHVAENRKRLAAELGGHYRPYHHAPSGAWE